MMRVTKSAMKKLAFAAMAGAAMLLVAAGLWLRSPWLVLPGVLAGFAVMGLLALLTFRRAGYLIVLGRESEATLRQELADIAREQARIADEMHRAALADFRELMLSAYREIFDEVQALAAAEARAEASQRRIEQGVARIGAMADALDGQVSATRAMLAKRADALEASLETLGRQSSGRLASLQDGVDLLQGAGRSERDSGLCGLCDKCDQREKSH